MCRSDTQQPTTAPSSSSTPVEPLTEQEIGLVRATAWSMAARDDANGEWATSMLHVLASLDAAVARAEAAERRAGVIRAGKLAAMGVAADTEEAYFKLKAANADLSRQLAEARLGREQDAQAQLERTALWMADVDNAERRAKTAETALAETQREVG